jgi:hypothetical protein
MRNGVFAALAMCLIAAPATAQAAVVLSSAVFVERVSHTDDGRIERRVEPASRLAKGDIVVLMVEWRNPRFDRGFFVSSPIPATLAFQGSSRDGEQVSVDGGRHWGELGSLTFRDSYGLRLASPEDVTNVRWPVSAQEAAQGSGRITYSAVVR